MADGSTSDSDRAVLLAALADELAQPRSEESTAEP